MEQPAGPTGDLTDNDTSRVVIETTGPPILNQTAAGVLLRILLRAGERDGAGNIKRPSDPPLRSDS